MSKYIIYNGTFYSADSDELMHWKYVKREKKNGKWVYTYDKLGSKVADTSVEVRDTDKWGSSKTTAIVNDTHKSVIYNRGKLERLSDVAKSKLGVKDYFDNRTKDWYESKDRATEKAVNRAKKDGAELRDTDTHGSSKVTLTVGDHTSTTYYRGKRDRYVETAKEYVRDRFGYDEKAYMDEMSREAERAGKHADRHMDAASISKMREADIRVKDAKRVFYDTPLGKVTKVKENISSAKEYLTEYLKGNRRKK